MARLGPILPAPLVLLLMALALSVVPGTAAAETGADNGYIELPTGVAQLVPDATNGRVWVRPRAGGKVVMVVDLDDSTVHQVSVPTGMTDLALNADATKAYAAAGDMVVEIDGSSFATRNLPLGDGCTRRLAAGAVMVHLDDDCGSGLNVLDPRTGETLRRPGFGTPHSVAGRDRVLFSTPEGLSLVDASTSDVVAQHEFGNQYLDRRVQVSSDGAHVMHTAHTGDAVQVRDVETLGAVTAVPGAEPTREPDWGGRRAADLAYGLLTVLDPQGRIQVYDAESGLHLNSLLPWSGENWWLTSTTQMSGAVIIGASSPGGRGALFVEDAPQEASPTLELTRPEPVDTFTPTPITGRLSQGGEPLPGETVTLTWDDGSELGTATTDETGRFTSRAKFPRSALVTARWSGSRATPPAVAKQPVSAPQAPTEVHITAPGELAPTDDVPLAIHLATSRGRALPGLTVELSRRCVGEFNWQPVATLTTDSSGGASFADDAPRCAAADYRAQHMTTQTTYGSSDTARAFVTWRTASLHLLPRSPVLVGDPTTLAARLVIDGAPASGRDVLLDLGRGEPPRLLTTDAEGMATTQATFTNIGGPYLRWSYPGDATTLGASAWEYLPVARGGTVLEMSASPAGAVLGESVTLSGVLRDQRGRPVPEAVITLIDVWSQTTTDADGRWSMSVEPQSWDPHYVYEVMFEGNQALEESGAVTTVDVRPRPSQIRVHADRTRIRPGDEVRVSGQVQHLDGTGIPGSDLSVVRRNPDGTSTPLPDVRRDADGRFTFSDSPEALGGTSYDIKSQRDDSFASEVGTVHLTVSTPAPIELELTTDRSRYPSGATARVSATTDLATSGVLVVEALHGDHRVVVHDGPLPSGGLSWEVALAGSTRFVARLAGNDDHLSATDEAQVDVLLGMDSVVTNAWTRRRGVWLVPPQRRARLVTDNASGRDDVCLAHEVQRQRGSRWLPVTTTSCVEPSAGLGVVHRLAGPRDSRWRVRPLFEGDALHAPSRGAWVRVLFARPRP